MSGRQPAVHRPLFCLVTDRLTLAGGARDSRTAVALLLDQVEAAARAGVDLVHVRERDLEARELTELVTGCVARVAGSRARVIVNDRADVALAAGAAGVHLRGDSMPAARVRALVPPGFLVGRSVRNAEQAVEAVMAGGLDYLVLGTIFPTPSKPSGETLVGLPELERAARLVSLPVLAIGGVTPETLPAIARAGAGGVAAVRLFQDAVWQGGALEERLRDWRRSFDTRPSIP